MLEGLFTALVTPFYSDGRFNEKKMEELVRFQAVNDVAGVVPAGTTGENPTYSDKEYLRVFESTVGAAKDAGILTIAGCGSNNTEKAIILSSKAAEIGADYSLVITPYYNKPNQEGLYKHFSLIADNSPIPIIMYNVPSRTGVNLLPQTVERLSYHENIVAVKEASGSMTQVQDIIFAIDNRMVLFSGEDELTYSTMAVGGKGVISVSSNIIPAQMNKLVNQMLQGKFQDALLTSKEVNSICKGMFLDTNPIVVKAAMNMLGMDVGPTRMPLTKMDEDLKVKLKKILVDFGLKIQK